MAQGSEEEKSMKGAETAWRAWRYDNKGRYPRNKAAFVKSVYMDAFEDGARTKQHNALMSRLEEIMAKVERQP